MDTVLKRFSPLAVLLAVMLAFAVGSLVLADTAHAAAAPAKAKIAKVTSPAPGKVKVKVKKAKGAKKYQYQVSLKKNFKGKSTATKKTKKKTAVFKGLAQGKTYYVRVKALKGSKSGKWSAVKTVVVKKAGGSNPGNNPGGNDSGTVLDENELPELQV